MPSKGSDLDALSAKNAIEHLKNREAIITPKGSRHKSTASYCVGAIYEYTTVILQGHEAIKDTIECNSLDVPNLAHDDFVEITEGMFTVLGIQKIDNGMKLIILEKYNG